MKTLREKKKLKAYVPEALEYFGKCLLTVRQTGNSKNNSLGVQIKLDGLQKAIHALDKTDRERIEKFWGLKGGPIHSKKLVRYTTKDVAYISMCNLAVESVKKLLTLDYVIMYDSNASTKVSVISEKVNRNGIEVSDIECVKYLMAFLIYAENGPKMSFEEEDMNIDTTLDGNFFFDEFEVLNQMYEEMKEKQEKSIDLRLIMDFFEMLDLQDVLIIKKSIGIEIHKDSLPQGVSIEDIGSIRSVSRIRELKERMFPYGAWDVVTKLILGKEEKAKLNDFMKELDSIRRDWDKVAEFKSTEKRLKTKSEVRTLNVYNIGGLEFTDAYEVMFLYLERNLIAPEL